MRKDQKRKGAKRHQQTLEENNNMIWTQEEESKYHAALDIYGKNFKMIDMHMGGMKDSL